MNQIEQDYPYNREWCIDSVVIDHYVALQLNWKESQKLICTIRDCLKNANIHSAVETVASAGSIGRMEACPGVSDADLIVVVSNEIDLESVSESVI